MVSFSEEQRTVLGAGQGEAVLANQVVLGGGVVVLHQEAHHGQLRNMDQELKVLVPHGVEACRGLHGSLDQHFVFLVCTPSVSYKAIHI